MQEYHPYTKMKSEGALRYKNINIPYVKWNGELLVSGSAVAQAIGYKNVSDPIQSYVPERRRRRIAVDKKYPCLFIPVDGVASVLKRSRLRGKHDFAKWWFAESGLDEAKSYIEDEKAAQIELPLHIYKAIRAISGEEMQKHLAPLFERLKKIEDVTQEFVNWAMEYEEIIKKEVKELKECILKFPGTATVEKAEPMRLSVGLTLLGFRNLSNQNVSKMSRELHFVCDYFGIPVGTVPSKRHGTVHGYKKSAIDIYAKYISDKKSTWKSPEAQYECLKDPAWEKVKNSEGWE